VRRLVAALPWRPIGRYAGSLLPVSNGKPDGLYILPQAHIGGESGSGSLLPCCGVRPCDRAPQHGILGIPGGKPPSAVTDRL